MADSFQHFFPIHEGHGKIQENEIVLVLLNLLDSFFPVEGTIHLMPLLFKGFAEFLANHFFVIDDQEFDDVKALPKTDAQLQVKDTDTSCVFKS